MTDLSDIFNFAHIIENRVNSFPLRNDFERELVCYILWRSAVLNNDISTIRKMNEELFIERNIRLKDKE